MILYKNIKMRPFIKNNLWGLKNYTKEIVVVEPKYENINYPNKKGISEIVIIDKSGDNKYGILDWNTGEELIEPKYDFIYKPKKGISLVRISDKSGFNKFGLLDWNTGNILVEPLIDSSFGRLETVLEIIEELNFIPPKNIKGYEEYEDGLKSFLMNKYRYDCNAEEQYEKNKDTFMRLPYPVLYQRVQEWCTSKVNKGAKGVSKFF